MVFDLAMSQWVPSPPPNPPKARHLLVEECNLKNIVNKGS